MRRPMFMLLCALPAVAGCGCRPLLVTHNPEAYIEWSASRIERLRMFAHIDSIAVAPVLNDTGLDHLDVPLLEQAIVNQLIATHRFREVIGPGAMRLRMQARGINLSSENIAALAGALTAVKTDAILLVTVRDYDPYPPPRITLRMRLFATPRTVQKGFDPISMTDDGVPSDVPGSLRRRFVWAWDRVLDTGHLAVRQDVAAYAWQHAPDAWSGDAETFVRAMGRFFKFAANQAAMRLRSDALAFFYMPPQEATLVLRHMPSPHRPSVLVPMEW